MSDDKVPEKVCVSYKDKDTGIEEIYVRKSAVDKKLEKTREVLAIIANQPAPFRVISRSEMMRLAHNALIELKQLIE